jgi:hypothetical protein
MPSKSSSRTLDLPATIEENLSYSGFYCTLDLEQKTSVRNFHQHRPGPIEFSRPPVVWRVLLQRIVRNYLSSPRKCMWEGAKNSLHYVGPCEFQYAQ